jgi:hypothetical protein
VISVSLVKPLLDKPADAKQKMQIRCHALWTRSGRSLPALGHRDNILQPFEIYETILIPLFMAASRSIPEDQK